MMKEFSGIRRLEQFDYSQPGAYFITICANERGLIFGEILNGLMICNPAGEMIEKEWLLLPERYSQLVMDEYVVMPNHFHAIVWIQEREEDENSVGAPLVGASGEERGDKPRAYEDRSGGAPLVGASGEERGDKPRAYEEKIVKIELPDIVGVFKSLTTNKYIQGVKLSGWPPFNKKIWQQNYYEHIIRDERDLGRIREYMINNPIQWDLDEENPSRRGSAWSK